MNLAWPAWVLVICVAASLVCVVYGALRAVRAARVVKKHADSFKNSPLLADVAKAEVYVTRINEDVAAIDELLARANAAIRTINDGIAEMRLPEAVIALRTAGNAIRLIFNSR